MRLSKHAKVRMQQRGIPRRIVDWLVVYGSINHQGPGTEMFFFDKSSRNWLEKDKGQRKIKKYSKCMKAYLVCIDNTIVTVGHRYRHVVRP